MATPQEARAELARREIARRAALKAQPAPQASPAPAQAQSNPTSAPYEQTGLEKAAEFFQPLAEPAARIQSTIPLAAGFVNPALGLSQYAGSEMNRASGGVSENTAEGLGYLSSKLTPSQTSGVQAIGDYGAATTGMVAGMLVNPMSYLASVKGGIGAGPVDTRLGPIKGKPSMGARFKELRTGVKASSFDRLRRDPGAFIETTSREDAGITVGKAKENSGISLGVTDDTNTLTTKNLQKARNVRAAGAQAENAVVKRIENVLESGELETVEPGAKTGSPHALFAYTDEFGEGGQPRNIYNIYGDPADPIFKKVGHGSSVQKADLDAAGIPVAGREPRSAPYKRIPQNIPMEKLADAAKITPEEVSTALDGINARLTRIERAEGRQSANFQQWSAIKNQFQQMLETVAPEVKQANADFSRVALRDQFMEANPVNQSGTMSKIDSWGFDPASIAAGGFLGGPLGAVAAYVGKKLIRSPFVAGATTAMRGGLDKLVDPGLSGAANMATRSGPLVGQTNDNPNERLKEFARRFVKISR